jgi:hypothetical protein
MEQEFKKGSLERAFFSEFYELCEKYWVPEDNDNYWRSMIRDTEALNEKYKELQPLSKEIIVGFVCGLTAKKDGELD